MNKHSSTLVNVNIIFLISFLPYVPKPILPVCQRKGEGLENKGLANQNLKIFEKWIQVIYESNLVEYIILMQLCELILTR